MRRVLLPASLETAFAEAAGDVDYETFAFLMGPQSTAADGAIRVTDLYFPEQEATLDSCNATDSGALGAFDHLAQRDTEPLQVWGWMHVSKSARAHFARLLSELLRHGTVPCSRIPSRACSCRALTCTALPDSKSPHQRLALWATNCCLPVCFRRLFPLLLPAECVSHMVEAGRSGIPYRSVSSA